MADLQAPQNNDTCFHETLRMRGKMEAQKEPKIPKFELFWLISAEAGTE